MRYTPRFETPLADSALVVLNANARRFRQRRVLQRLERSLHRLPSTQVLRSKTIQEAQQAIADSTADLLVVGGGDGAVNLALNARHRLPRLAVLPGGTANDLARALRLPLTADAALAHALNPPRALDLLRVNGRRFATTGGLGVPQQVAVLANRVKRRARRLGHRVYDAAAARVILSAKRQPVDLQWTDPDGAMRRWSTRSFGVLITNVGQVAGNLRLCDARPDDGIFEICVLTDTHRAGLMRTLAQLSAGRAVGPDQLRVIRAVDAEMQTPRCGFFGDGEPFEAADRFAITLERHALTVAGGHHDR
jgi:diacylglycerol kinase family enzyme